VTRLDRLHEALCDGPVAAGHECMAHIEKRIVIDGDQPLEQILGELHIERARSDDERGMRSPERSQSSLECIEIAWIEDFDRCLVQSRKPLRGGAELGIGRPLEQDDISGVGCTGGKKGSGRAREQ